MANKSYHHGNLRNSLIEAGIELINQEGINQLSLRKVASLCGVSQAAPYAHFKSKEDLMGAMRDHVIGLFMEVLEKAAFSCSNQNDPRLLVEMGKRYVLFFIENPKYFTFIFSQHYMEVNLDLEGDDTKNFPPYQLFKTHAIRILGNMGMTYEKIEDGIISMWATVHGLASIATMKNVHYSKEWGEKIEDIIWNK
ncbi:MAG: putative TetR family transcriptional regulator [Anaerosolibacter sp.]|jgi:AcrR family transcriptional regulator|uniref:TetR/AcrR family transcriptional regulator n=1 Tax=Anaerosolibacter sp. TaxID=1872527 RepID=UPI00261BD7E0|nr:TetR/AcrR family transcriptional regulator [Anaerosolibacter sp.]MDF2546776.1 putative TetR family transcriptional regulator [Anaerosolibacter sp.]